MIEINGQDGWSDMTGPSLLSLNQNMTWGKPRIGFSRANLFRMKAGLDNDWKRRTRGAGKSTSKGVPTLIDSSGGCSNVNLGEVWSWLDISSRVGARGLTPSSLVL